MSTVNRRGVSYSVLVTLVGRLSGTRIQSGQINWEECGSSPVSASYTLVFALQLRKKHGKTSVRVEFYTSKEGHSKMYIYIYLCVCVCVYERDLFLFYCHLPL
jgi:hypothetical protein